ncbi:MAG: Na/Pi symporter [Acidobacteria bacterium]|nr:Na/Pi symporter [Acidobacteriota bacterium]
MSPVRQPPTQDSPRAVTRLVTVLLLLFGFLIGVKGLGEGFRLLGGDFLELIFTTTENPFIGLVVGILATTIVQSSSVTTSMIVGFVAAPESPLPLANAVPMIMGANIGTTVTNILVSFTFVTRKEDFRRAFAGATVHDFFNLLTVLVFFPLELKFHFIQRLAVVLTKVFEGVGGVQFTSPMKAVIGPAVHSIEHLLLDLVGFSKEVSGTIMLIGALVVMFVSLIYLVKLMRSLIIGQTEVFVDRYLFRNDLSAFLLGVCLTVAVQSSSITTSLAVPLVAAGILSLQRCYPFTLGTNIGTTCTAILASLATVTVIHGQAANTVGVTAAFAHLVFNLFGIAVFYPLKRIPIWCARRMADVATRSKLLAVIFVLGVFFIVPILAIFLTR